LILIIIMWKSDNFSATQIRGCTGFDGGFEVLAAIRGSDRVNNRNLKLNAEDNLAYAA